MRDYPEARTIGFGVTALLYASLGYAVVPCERGGKKPHRMLPESGGVHWASKDPAIIRSWWSADPAASIGVATGSPSALAVIDTDLKGGRNGMAALGSLMTGQGWTFGWPPVIARTPSGGAHIWLRAPDGSPERPGILPGVDLKGDGGYVIAPPSARLVMPAGLDGEPVREPVPVPYEWSEGCPCLVPEVPPWMINWAHTAPGGHKQQQAPLTDAPDLDALKATGAAVGERNHTLYRLACQLYRKFGTTQMASARVLEELEAVWRAGDTRDFGHRELLICAESARKFIVRQEQAELRMRQQWLAWMLR